MGELASSQNMRRYHGTYYKMCRKHLSRYVADFQAVKISALWTPSTR